MTTSFRKRLLLNTNKILAPVGVEIIRKNKAFQSYIPLKKTLKDAAEAGLPLGEYIDDRFNVPGTTQATIDKMKALGVFSKRLNQICEIGPGSGRYLEKVIQLAKPDSYEIYETSTEWREWLTETYRVISREADGASLSSTSSMSIDLVHTHKVLYGNPIVIIFKYLSEIVRVVRAGGYVVFDLLTEDCLTEAYIEKWVSSGVDHACSMTAKSLALNYFITRGFSYEGGFIVPMMPGVTEYFVFKRLK